MSYFQHIGRLQMPLTYINYTLLATNRTDIRDEVLKLFLLETPGTGKGTNASKFIYTVEQMNQTYKIDIIRPAYLNKGMDIIVSVPGVVFTHKGKKRTSKDNVPSHENIFDALLFVLNNNSQQYGLVKTALTSIYNCQPYNSNSLLGITYIDAYSSIVYPIEIVVLALKWLFIEQDLTYWNWSGREMMWNGLKDRKLV